MPCASTRTTRRASPTVRDNSRAGGSRARCRGGRAWRRAARHSPVPRRAGCRPRCRWPGTRRRRDSQHAALRVAVARSPPQAMRRMNGRLRKYAALAAGRVQLGAVGVGAEGGSGRCSDGRRAGHGFPAGASRGVSVSFAGTAAWVPGRARGSSRRGGVPGTSSLVGGRFRRQRRLAREVHPRERRAARAAARSGVILLLADRADRIVYSLATRSVLSPPGHVGEAARMRLAQ